MSDPIDRSKLIDYIMESNPDWCVNPIRPIYDYIVEMPSAQRKGKWIYLDGLEAFECSVCGGQMVRNSFDYCPWCGARMDERREDE